MRNLKKVLSLALAMVMLLGMMVIGAGAAVTTSKDFDDVEDIAEERVEAVDVMTAIGVFQGEDDNFNPEEVLTREQAATIVARMLLGEVADNLKATSATYSDVATDRWSAGYIEHCTKLGILGGYDGKFDPAGELTNVAFAKMMLCALGYEAEAEGFNGPNWAANVASVARRAGINTELVVNNEPMTREDAAQMAFNTLKADTVEYTYKGQDGYGRATSVENKKNDYRYYNLNNGIGSGNNTTTPTNKGDETMQFCELYFPTLKLTEDDVDGYADIVARWKLVQGNKTETISETDVSYALRYTERVTYAKIYADLGMTGAHNADVYTDGNANKTSITVSASNFTVAGGNGAVTTVWTDERGDAARITVKNTYVGDIAGVNTNGSVTVAPRLGLENGTETIGTATATDLVTGDVVLYMRRNGSIVNVEKATPVSGTLTAFTSHTTSVNGNATLGTDSAAEYSAKLARQAQANALGQNVTVIKDQYGYILDVSEFTTAPQYALVIKTAKSAFQQDQALVVDENGQMHTWNITNNAKTWAGNGDILVNYRNNYNGTYTLGVKSDGSLQVSSDGQHVMTAANNVSKAGVQMTTKGSNVIRVTGDNATAPAVNNTVFIVKTGTNQYAAYQGIANVPSMKVGSSAIKTAALVSGGVARAVYIDASAPGSVLFSGNASDAIYIKSINGLAGNTSNGAYYSCTAVVNGQLDTNFMAMPMNPLVAIEAKTMYNYAVKDATTGVTSIDTSIKAPSVIGSMAVSNYAVNLQGTGATGGFVYNDYTTHAYVLSEDGSFGRYDIKLIATDGNDKIWYSAVDSTLALVVVEKIPGSVATLPGSVGGMNTITSTTPGNLNNQADRIKYAPGAYTFTTLPTVPANDAGSDASDVLFFFFNKLNMTNTSGTAVLSIKNSAGTTIWSESVTTSTTNWSNGFFYISKSACGLTAGNYTWSITGTNAETVSGTFTIN